MNSAPPRVASVPAASLPVVDRFFEFSLLGMLAAGYFAVVGSGYLDWPTSVLTFLGLCLRGFMIAGVVRIDLSNRVTTVLTLLYIGFYPLDFQYVSGSFLTATVHMVFFLAVLKILTARTNRDHAYVKMIAILELLAAALLSANVSFFAFLALFLLFAIASLASGEVQRSAQLKRSVVRAALPAFPRRLGMLAIFLFAGILTMTAGFFFVLPRTARAALARFVPQRYHLPGFTNEITLGEIGRIKQSNAPVMHVRSYQSDGPLYVKWRGASLAEFDGKRWFNPPGNEIVLRVQRGVLTLRRIRPAARPGRSVIYQVQLNDIAADTLFVAGTPETISINLPFVRYTSGGSFRVPRFGASGLGYGVYSFLEDESAASVSEPIPLAGWVRNELLELPALDERIPQLARDMSEGSSTDEDKARAIERRLRSDYGYTLDLLPATVEDPLAHFLFVRKKGHCEYFASAMAVMLRTLGIPSRVVTGFQSGVYNPMTGWQVVRASDAHSWVEAWIPDRGWTTFDPTPSDPNASTSGPLAKLSLIVDAVGQFWQDWVLSYDLDRQIVLASRMEETSRRFRLRWIEGIGTGFRKAGQAAVNYWGVLLGAAVFILIAVLYGPALLRLWANRRRVRRLERGEGEPSDATLLYQRMLTILNRRGIRKAPWLTPAEFAHVIPASDVSILVGDLTSAYNEFRFGGRRDVAPQMVRLLDRLEKL